MKRTRISLDFINHFRNAIEIFSDGRDLIKYNEKLMIRKCKLEKKKSNFQVPKIFFDYTLIISKIQFKDTQVKEEEIYKKFQRFQKKKK